MGSPFGHHQRPPPEASPATPSPFTPPRAKRYWVSSCALQRIQDRGCIDPLHGREVLLAGYCRQQFQPPPASTPTPIRLQSSTLLFRERERCARTLRLVTTVPATAIGMEWCCNVEVVFYEWECCGIRLGCCGIGMENEFDGGDLHVGAFLADERIKWRGDDVDGDDRD
ncbi:hypothetical protein DEO72_LG11g1612 [Vigna unguiculata]|uniref:Uncharacterized protein n=1 Tax=Vigna unguiculata TaxID=3917 RepID=A0A4D6NPZ6_VIGUN|nr:hypothetical protein DEO72_LG11g1612 [Vigna unguiculata]